MTRFEQIFRGNPKLARQIAAELTRIADGAGTEDGTNEDDNVELSLVFPIYNEEENIPELYRRIAEVLGEITVKSSEILFVNDGSTDRSEAIIRQLRERDPRVKLVNFSRNFGHQAAITAGMELSRGEAVILMDSDLQDPPEVLGKMVEAWREGGEVIYAVRTNRKEPFLKKYTAYWFYRLLQTISNIDIPLDSGDFCLMDRRVVDRMNQLPERNRYVRGLRSWVGFRQVSFPFDRPERFAGSTKYPLRKMVKLAVTGMLSFSSLPLNLATYLGFLIMFLGSLYTVGLVVAYFYGVDFLRGWTSLMVVVLFIGGSQLLILGVVGRYVAFINDEVKQRPNFVIREFLD